ncbi:hypothetical protein ANCDUO_03492 [Ancylostoma duodenale]|uniref:Uncharacterized protein n=1 Tax=Ancylostoma duodenale TaxID=51022 RepID=A0A0C2H9I4_9BILA|nr:hypothetical protein ANCDUO_03492 [Ancylostoma duodenale]
MLKRTHHVSGPPDLSQLGVSGNIPDLRLLTKGGTPYSGSHLREADKHNIQKGIENTYRLGTFLRERYVDNGFLRRPVLPSQVYFRSKGNNRCLMSASLVASAMFSVYGQPTTSAVPVYTQEGKDSLLGGGIDCDAEVNRIVAQCGRTPKKSYANVSSMYFNGLPMPKWFEEHKGEIIGDFIKMDSAGTKFRPRSG